MFGEFLILPAKSAIRRTHASTPQRIARSAGGSPYFLLVGIFSKDTGNGIQYRRPINDRDPTRERAAICVASYFEMQALTDLQRLIEFVSSGGSMALESGFVKTLAPELIEIVAGFLEDAPPYAWVSLDHYLHGAVCRPASTHSAFPLRQPGYSSRILSAWREPGQAEISAEWARLLDLALRTFAGGAMYLNYLTAEAGDEGVRAAYGSNYARLAELKGKHDPTNFFNSNRNIRPELGPPQVTQELRGAAFVQ